MTSKIEALIDEIEEYINNCKFQTLSNTRIIVNKDEIDELLRELRMNTPEEIKRYQKMISQRDAILADAKKKADALINEATIQTNQLVNEHEIMQQAYAKANEVVTMATKQAQEVLDKATIEANSVRAAAMQYTDDLLANLEKIITHAAQSAVTNYNELIGNLNSCNGIIKENRTELHPGEDDDLESLSLDTGETKGTLDIM
ncbi:MAG: vacuolar family H+-ATPase subunit H [Lachnospiraceae bacterium]|jgi:cell division septum initiation protein DivIVA|nr:vacuolar family H+-ATPase subunit H [Lachnospiraceae bacterium]